MPRAHRLVLPLVAFLFGLVALGLAIFVTLRPGAETGGAGIGAPFALRTTEGKIVTEKDLVGSPSLIFFGFTHCPDVCPTTLQDISQVYQALGVAGDGLRTYFVTIDPGRDTPDALRAYLSSFDPRIVGLRGDPAATDAAVKAFRAYAKRVELPEGGYTMDHTALVYLMDGSGRFVGSLPLERAPADTAKELRRYLSVPDQ